MGSESANCVIGSPRSVTAFRPWSLRDVWSADPLRCRDCGAAIAARSSSGELLRCEHCRSAAPADDRARERAHEAALAEIEHRASLHRRRARERARGRIRLRVDIGVGAAGLLAFTAVRPSLVVHSILETLVVGALFVFVPVCWADLAWRVRDRRAPWSRAALDILGRSRCSGCGAELTVRRDTTLWCGFCRISLRVPQPLLDRAECDAVDRTWHVEAVAEVGAPRSRLERVLGAIRVAAIVSLASIAVAAGLLLLARG